jgi:hypothetical protein
MKMQSNSQKFLLLIGISIILQQSIATAQTSRSFQFKVEETTTIMTTENMNTNGLMFPDEPIGFVQTSKPGQYLAFAAAGSFSGIRGKAPAGTYEFKGTLEHLMPANTSAQGPKYSLTGGRVQPSPDGSDFDRDYAGGSFTYLTEVKAHQPVLLQIYHGEYEYFYPKGLPAYGGGGLAVSYDNGNTFTKIGQILYPQLSRKDYLATNPKGGLWCDGSMIEADGNGHYIAGNSKSIDQNSKNSKDIYEYLVFTDHNSAQEIGNVIGLARARKNDVMNAVANNRAPVFYKYYNPQGNLVFDEKFFVEPGIGGKSTPIVNGNNQAINSPDIVYDTYIQKYILSYQYNQTYIVLQTSNDLMHWSAPVIVVNISSQSNERLFNPSIIGADIDGNIPERRFYIYYLQREMGPNHNLFNPRLQRISITIN